MKKSFFKILVVFLLAFCILKFFPSCMPGNPSEEEYNPGSGSVTMTGVFTGGTHARLWLKKIMDQLVPSVYGLDPNQVQKVIVFGNENNFTVAPVEDNAFSVSFKKDQPGAMIFVGAADNYLGYLTLKNGIDTIPLTFAPRALKSINLDVLSSSGKVVTSSHNPVGAEIPLSAEVIRYIAQADDLLASIAMNPDVDGDGKIDLLAGKFFKMKIGYDIDGGYFGTAMTPVINSPVSIHYFRLALHAFDTDRPTSVLFTGPAGSGFLNSPSDDYFDDDDGSSGYDSISSAVPVPPQGNYTVSYKTSALTFTLPDQSQLPNNIILPVPTVYLNADNTIHKITWVHQLSGGGVIEDPSAIVWMDIGHGQQMHAA